MSKNKNKTDLSRRQSFNEIENYQIAYKAITFNISVSKEIRTLINSKFNNFVSDNSKTRICNRCIFTGRSRSVYKKFRISRILIRQLAAINSIQGIQKVN